MQVARIVVVGCGSIGRRHARALSQRDDVVVEVCEPDPDNLDRVRAESGDLRAHPSFSEMLTSRPDMLLIATPPALHADQSIEALQAGAHVLCEKPMSDSVADARRMVAAAENCNRVLDIGFTLHFHPAMQYIKRLIHSGELGAVLHVHWHVGTFATLVNSVTRHQANTYGALMMDYAHQPDVIFWWLQKAPIRIHSVGVLGEGLPLLSRPNVMAVTLEYDGPTMATINLNFVQHPERSYCEIIGDQAWCAADLQSNRVQVGVRDTSAVKETAFAFERDDLFRAEHDAFIRAARGERPVESPPASALQSMIVVEAAIQSLHSRLPVLVA